MRVSVIRESNPILMTKGQALSLPKIESVLMTVGSTQVTKRRHIVKAVSLRQHNFDYFVIFLNPYNTDFGRGG
jgi:hypothetical protein